MSAAEVYPPLLTALGGCDERVVVVDAGLGSSMQTGQFRAAFPRRYVNLGIAEANAIGFASGLARRGLRPFVHSFSNFLARRAHDQIAISIVVPGLPVTLVAGSCGVFDGRNGPSHFAGDDLAGMCALPGMTVLEPADAADLATALEWAHASEGPVYLRLRRHGMPQAIGDPRQSREAVRRIQLDPASPVVTVVAIGAIVDEVVTACRILIDHGIIPELFHVLRIKPLDASMILASARSTARIVVVENHVAHGGSAADIAALAAREAIRCDALTLPDNILPAGDPRWLLVHCGLDATSIAERISTLLNSKSEPCSSILPH
jgi:transketolase